jgi:hypothetical protein
LNKADGLILAPPGVETSRIASTNDRHAGDSRNATERGAALY